MMFIPIFVPHREPDRCPSCKELEKKVDICDHCGYRYPIEKSDNLFLLWWIPVIGGLGGLGYVHWFFDLEKNVADYFFGAFFGAVNFSLVVFLLIAISYLFRLTVLKIRDCVRGFGVQIIDKTK